MRFPFPPGEAEETQPMPESEVVEAGAVNSGAEDGCAVTVSVAGLAETLEPVPVSASLRQVANEQPETVTAGAVELPDADSCLADIAAEPDPVPSPVPDARPHGRRKVIAFPRPASAPPETRHRLADPVVPEQLRILDVPEELEAFPTARLLDGLELPLSAQQAAVAPTDHIELPFRAVGLSRRVYAGLIDCAAVAAAAGVFAAVSYKMLPKLALSKPVLMAAAAIPILLWVAYQYVFTMYGCGTPGMRMLGMRLRTFKGGAPELAPSSQPRHRAVFFDRIAHDGPVVGAGGRGLPVLARPHQPHLSHQTRVNRLRTGRRPEAKKVLY